MKQFSSTYRQVKAIPVQVIKIFHAVVQKVQVMENSPGSVMESIIECLAPILSTKATEEHKEVIIDLVSTVQKELDRDTSSGDMPSALKSYWLKIVKAGLK